jgi:hypothetical protein
MLQVLLLGCNNTFIDPLINKLSNNSILTKSVLKVGIATFAYMLSSFCPPLILLTSTIFTGVIAECTNTLVLQPMRAFIEDKLDEYGYDQYMNIIDPIVDIGTFCSLNVIADFALDLPIQRNLTSDTTLHNVLITSNSPTNSNIIKDSFTTIAYNSGLSGIIKVVTSSAMSIYQYFSGNKNELSVYDIKNILKSQLPAEQYNRAVVKSGAEKIYFQIQQSNNYYANLENRPDVLEKIDIVNNLYLKNFGLQLKMQYATALTNNTDLIQKSEVLVEQLIMIQITERLSNARGSYLNLQKFKSENNIVLPELIKYQIKQSANFKLNEELKAFQYITTDEQNAYKALFEKSALIEIEESIIPYIISEITQMEPTLLAVD